MKNVCSVSSYTKVIIIITTANQISQLNQILGVSFLSSDSQAVSCDTEIQTDLLDLLEIQLARKQTRWRHFTITKHTHTITAEMQLITSYVFTVMKPRAFTKSPHSVEVCMTQQTLTSFSCTT